MTVNAEDVNAGELIESTGTSTSSPENKVASGRRHTFDVSIRRLYLRYCRTGVLFDPFARPQAVLFGELFLILGTFSLFNFSKVPQIRSVQHVDFSTDLIDCELRARNLVGSTESTSPILDPPLKL